MTSPREAAVEHAAACRVAVAAGCACPRYQGPRLARADLGGVDLSHASFYRAFLARVVLSYATLYRAFLVRVDLSHASLFRADLSYANLTGANLTEANLTEANLTGVDLTDASLSYANLTGVDLTNARLSHADLTGAKFDRPAGAPPARELRRMVADHIERHPDLFDQEDWGDGEADPSCRTPCCVAGWTCHFGGGRGNLTVSTAATLLLWVDGLPMPSFLAGESCEDILAALHDGQALN